MIEASFDASRARGAAVSGAYQYDTGQRLRLCGLPSPEELAERDDFLSGDVVTVQAQYSYKGDSQAESRLASYDEATESWLVAVPDAYLTRSAPVYVYVYVMYGSTEEQNRAKTCYEATFTPIGRAAPGTQVTPEQTNAWDTLVQEVNLTLTTMNTAISNANAAAEGANTATKNTNAAISRAETAAALVEGMTVEASTLTPGSAATAKISETNGHKHIAFGIPQGAKGDKGDTGATGPQGPKGDTGPAGVTFRLSGTTLYITTT